MGVRALILPDQQPLSSIFSRLLTHSCRARVFMQLQALGKPPGSQHPRRTEAEEGLGSVG